jgi:hypothetical protein
MKKEIELLCHAVKAVRYRFLKVLSGSKDNFGEFRVGEHTRTPIEIINHMTDLAAKTRTMMVEGHFNCPSRSISTFDAEVKRFVTTLDELHHTALSVEVDAKIIKKLMQGPIMDMATHIGQLAMLNGLCGNKIPWENYFEAEI